jgi:4'-phosphopantetheinyl transferase
MKPVPALVGPVTKPTLVVNELELNRKGRKGSRKGRRGRSSLRSFALMSPLSTSQVESGPSLSSGWVLSDNDVHVWRVPLNQSSHRTVLSFEVLSPDERAKAARFHFDKDRNQFIQARAALRFILSEYLNADPQTLEFCFGRQGKPALAGEHADSSLRFNLSRRDGLALIAVTRGREIGVDVELVHADLPVLEIAETSFSEAELATLRTLPESLRVKGFYNCWTRKEAYVKARGEGLSFPLQQFDVSLTPGAPAKLLEVRDDLAEPDRWTLQDIPVAENYVAALFVEGTDLGVTCRDWHLRQ